MKDKEHIASFELDEISPRQSPLTLQRLVVVSFPRTLKQTYEQASPSQWPNSPVSIGTFFGTLLLSLFLMITALPMAILAWEGKE